MIASIPHNFIFETIIRAVSSFDIIIYGFFSLVLKLFFHLNDILYDNELISTISTRLYILVGIFALFKIGFSLISTIVDPNLLTDKERGFANIIQRTIISIAILLFLPKGFSMLYSYQNDIIFSIPQIILGRSSAEEYSSLSTALSNTTLQTFISANLPDCQQDAANNGASLTFTTDNNGIFQISDIVGEECSNPKGVFRYNYMFGISTIVGLIMIIMFFFISVDVVIRSFELLALQMIAPLPIISYIDPKSAKGGMFDSWLKLTVKTYISLFVQIASVYFILTLIVQLLKNISLPDVLNLPATILIIIGGLLFLVKSKKFINQALGIKDSEGSFLGKMAGVAGLAIGGAALGTAGGFIAGGLNAAGSTNGNILDKGSSFLRGGLNSAKAAGLEGLANGLGGAKINTAFKTGLNRGEMIASGGEKTKFMSFIQKAQENSQINAALKNLGISFNTDADGNYIDENGKIIKNGDKNVRSAKELFQVQWAAAKQSKINTANQLSAATTAYQTGHTYTYNGKEYSGQNLYDLIYGYTDENGKEIKGLQALSGIAESKYNDLNKYASVYHLGSEEKTAIQKAQESMGWFSDSKYTSTITNDHYVEREVNVDTNVNENIVTNTNINGRTVSQTNSGIITGGDVEGLFNDMKNNRTNGNITGNGQVVSQINSEIITGGQKGNSFNNTNNRKDGNNGNNPLG